MMFTITKGLKGKRREEKRARNFVGFILCNLDKSKTDDIHIFIHLSVYSFMHPFILDIRAYLIYLVIVSSFV